MSCGCYIIMQKFIANTAPVGHIEERANPALFRPLPLTVTSSLGRKASPTLVAHHPLVLVMTVIYSHKLTHSPTLVRRRPTHSRSLLPTLIPETLSMSMRSTTLSYTATKTVCPVLTVQFALSGNYTLHWVKSSAFMAKKII